MGLWDVLVSAALGLAVNESCDLSPWAARRLVRQSARLRYSSPVRAVQRAEELDALITERPGKLFKLLTALIFYLAAVAHRAVHRDRQSHRLTVRELVGGISGSTVSAVMVGSCVFPLATLYGSPVPATDSLVFAAWTALTSLLVTLRPSASLGIRLVAGLASTVMSPLGIVVAIQHGLSGSNWLEAAVIVTTTAAVLTVADKAGELLTLWLVVVIALGLALVAFTGYASARLAGYSTHLSQSEYMGYGVVIGVSYGLFVGSCAGVGLLITRKIIRRNQTRSPDPH